ncbi:MAG: ABC transporter permease [Treponema sp.]|jgi:peptide/nickel transport system permease protein|nr:ABC transporter permease [Treponema sp.]
MKNKDEKIELSKKALHEYRWIVFLNFFRKRLVFFGFIITVLLALTALLAPVLAPHDIYEIDVANKLKAPSVLHYFGTDNLGRDILSRTMFGIRISMTVGFSTAAVTLVLGLLLGIAAGYIDFLDNLIMRICEGLVAIPPILMAIALVAALGASVQNVIIALSVVYIPTVARVARASTLSVKSLTYIEAEKAVGASPLHIIMRHIIPNIISPVIVQVTYIFASSIIIEAALSFLGAGVPQPAPSLGNMLYEAKNYIFNAWWMTILPGIFMVLTVLGLNLFGDGLRDILDPMSN